MKTSLVLSLAFSVSASNAKLNFDVTGYQSAPVRMEATAGDTLDLTCSSGSTNLCEVGQTKAAVAALSQFVHSSLCAPKMTSPMQLGFTDTAGARTLADGFCKYTCASGHHDASATGSCHQCTTSSDCSPGQQFTAGICSTLEHTATCSTCPNTRPTNSAWTSGCAFQCNSGWEGTGCDQDVVDCAAGTCMNGGSCSEGTPGSGTTSCACTSGWEGTDCNTAVFPTAYRLIGSTSGAPWGNPNWFELSEVELFDQHNTRVSPNFVIKTTLQGGNGANIQSGQKWPSEAFSVWTPYSAFAGKTLVEWDGDFDLTRASMWTTNVESFGTNPRIEKKEGGVWSNAGITITINYPAQGNMIRATQS